MRRRRSDDLPRFVKDHEPPPFHSRWRRRYGLYLVAVFFVCWILYPARSTGAADGDGAPAVKWSKYAYSLYATDSAMLCHAVLIFDALAEYGSKADRVLFYPEYWDTAVSDSKDRDSQLLVMARDTYKVKLQPIQMLTVEGRTADEWTGTWDKTVSKLMAFTLTQYDRVIALDSDITLLQHLDELFHLPPTPMAMPRAYWHKTKPWPLTSLLMVLQPSLDEFLHFKKLIARGGNEALVAAHKFDLELVNERFEDSAMVLPHRPYALLSAEFRAHNHSAYLGGDSGEEAWDAKTVLEEAKLVHFNDWPLPKPWIMWPQEGLAAVQPDCGLSLLETCMERRLWKGLYEDFRKRRRDVCRLLSVPAPEWTRIQGGGGEQDQQQLANITEGTHHEAPPVPGEGEAEPEVKAASGESENGEGERERASPA
ncbi:nucleotide-diphospho-sugar transferase [Massariosphaeria phaeospora]|uniref:Nucleotide-diphospho-sugar transferase n=1 Tax=Massariosphaeria phaeospora TaxID=100035 RepID=A0A7C8IEE5_9PLEO|nr:nucleotide-diphospho-sugar transferase [Massariosphaeria phaeospora]